MTLDELQREIRDVGLNDFDRDEVAHRIAVAIDAVAMLHVRNLEGEGYGAEYVQPEAYETALRALRGDP